MSWLMVAGWWGKMRAKANRKKSTFVFTIPPSLTNNTQLSSPQIRHIFLETGFKLHLSHLVWTKALVPVSLIFPFPCFQLSWSWSSWAGLIVVNPQLLSRLACTRIQSTSLNTGQWSVTSPDITSTTIQFLHFYYSNNLRSDDLSHQDVGRIFLGHILWKMGGFPLTWQVLI